MEGQKRRAKTAKKKKDKLENLFPDMATKPKPKTGKAKKKAQVGETARAVKRILSMSAPGSAFGDGSDDVETRAAKTQFHDDLVKQVEEKVSLDSDSEESVGSESGGDDSQDEAEMEDSASERSPGTSANDLAAKKGEGAQVGEAEKKESVSTESPASKPTAPSPSAPAASSSPPASGCCVIC